MKTLTIYLSDKSTIVDFMRTTIEGKLSSRYKMTHLAEDMKVSYSMLYRFMRGRQVGEEFFVKFFQHFSS